MFSKALQRQPKRALFEGGYEESSFRGAFLIFEMGNPEVDATLSHAVSSNHRTLSANHQAVYGEESSRPERRTSAEISGGRIVDL